MAAGPADFPASPAMSALRSARVVLALASLGLPCAAADVLEIAADTTLEPGKTYGPILIKASKITIDGRGAVIRGAKERDPKTFKGEGIFAQGVSDVTLKNVVVKGFEVGLHVKDGSGWTIEGCDFSDNFHDPEFGWGEQGRKGGLLLERVRSSTIKGCKANRVWDACTLVECDENTIASNDFSHASDTCLKLWNSTKNQVLRNNLSYGLRIKPGEVHARDSAGVLIESGSDDNLFRGNDATHGGDGFFIRSLNGWVSTRNQFLDNDASFANNNGFEAWSPRNYYWYNKANSCSYGFWLGASDRTWLVGNEANFNGDTHGFHNSPHLPDDGHAGIVFMFGSSSHTVVEKNICNGNNGAGIAFIGDAKRFKAYHWIVQDNTLQHNRWGIYARHADWINLTDNRFWANARGDFSRDETVTNVFAAEGAKPRGAGFDVVVMGPSRARVGEPVAFRYERSASAKEPDAPKEAPGIRWDLGEGIISGEAAPKHAFARPGLHRVGLTVTENRTSSLGWLDVYVADDLPEIAPEARVWSGGDPRSKVAFAQDAEGAVVGRNSVRARISPYSGGRTNLVATPDGGIDLEGKSRLIFWVQSRNENITGWQGPNPVVTLAGKDGALVLTPKVDRLQQPENSEDRWGWARVEVPLNGDDRWEMSGTRPKRAETVSIGIDSWGNDPLTVWIDGVAVR